MNPEEETHQTLRHLALQAEDSEDPEDYARLDALLIAAIGRAESAASLWSLMSLEGLDEAAFAEGRFPAPIVAAMIARALELGDAEALGVALRVASYEPAAVLDGADWKPAVRDAIGAQASRLRGAWGEASPQLRAQLAHAFAVGEVAGAEDHVRTLLSSSEDAEVHALALAAYALLAGEDSRQLLGAALGRADFHVRLMAACALSRLGERLDRDAARVFVKALKGERSLPKWWGFRTWDCYEDAAELTKRALHAAHLEDPDEVLRALAAREDGGWRESETLLHFAFFAEGRDPLGPIAASLRPPQRQALLAHTRAPLRSVPGALHPAGFAQPDDIEPFLAEQGPLWSVRDLRVGDRVARWSLVRIWRAYLEQVISYDDALGALTTPLHPADLFALVITEKRGILLSDGGPVRDPARTARDADLVRGCVQAILDAEFDLVPALHEAFARGVFNARQAVTIACLLALQRSDVAFSDKEWEEIAIGVGRAGESVADLVGATSAYTQERLRVR